MAQDQVSLKWTYMQHRGILLFRDGCVVWLRRWLWGERRMHCWNGVKVLNFQRRCNNMSQLSWQKLSCLATFSNVGHARNDISWTTTSSLQHRGILLFSGDRVGLLPGYFGWRYYNLCLAERQMHSWYRVKVLSFQGQCNNMSQLSWQEPCCQVSFSNVGQPRNNIS